MKLAQFKTKSSPTLTLGILRDEKVIDVVACARALKESSRKPASWLLEGPGSLDVIKRGAGALAQLEELLEDKPWRSREGLAFSLDAIEFLPAVYPGKILAIGRNYVDHAIEGGAPPPQAPLIFNKLPNSLSAHNAPIVLPKISTQVDYEAELAVVIGRTTKRIDEAEALDYVFGYTLIDDVSA